MNEHLSIIISLIALTISGVTMWLTLLRRGKLRMTKPNVIFFGYDFVPKTTPKIFLRTLLFSTAAQGNVVESMYVKISRGEKTENFSFWGYGESHNLVPGSGLYVGKTGISANHHFVLSIDKPAYEFGQGDYKIDVYAKVFGIHAIAKLSTVKVSLTAANADALAEHNGVLFELSPETQNYVGHLNNRTT